MSDATQLPSKERDAFEVWAQDKFSLHRNPRDPSRYLMETPAIAWKAWQARADQAIRERASNEPPAALDAWKLAPGDERCVFPGDTAKPINCMSKGRAALVVAAVNAYRAAPPPGAKVELHRGWAFIGDQIYVKADIAGWLERGSGKFLDIQTKPTMQGDWMPLYMGATSTKPDAPKFGCPHSHTRHPCPKCSGSGERDE